MAESFVQVQVRLVLQRQCREAADRLARCLTLPFTLIFFDYAEAGGEHNNMAFVTTLKKPALLDSWRRLLDSWEGKPTRVPGALSERTLRGFGDIVRYGFGETDDAPKVPAGVGFALLVGSGAETSYIATGDRVGMAELIRELLVDWERDL